MKLSQTTKGRRRRNYIKFSITTFWVCVCDCVTDKYFRKALLVSSSASQRASKKILTGGCPRFAFPISTLSIALWLKTLRMYACAMYRRLYVGCCVCVYECGYKYIMVDDSMDKLLLLPPLLLYILLLSFCLPFVKKNCFIKNYLFIFH